MEGIALALGMAERAIRFVVDKKEFPMRMALAIMVEEGGKMILRVAIRGFVGDKVLFEDRADVESDDLDALLPGLAHKHSVAMAEHRLHMIEIEFLDERDPLQRFFRIGTDPSGMVVPMRFYERRIHK